MTIKQFAEKYTLKLKRDEDGDMTIPGRNGKKSHIYLHTEGLFGAMCLLDSSRRWNRIRNESVQAGCRVHQDGDREGCLLFDPKDDKQARAAIAAIRAKVKRKASPAQLEALEKAHAALKMAKEAAQGQV